MKEYDHKKLEKKWQTIWEKKKIYQAKDSFEKPKFYSLIEFPYPSGDGLHVGHPRPYIGMDIISRKRRMEGYNVLCPIGWDAFGLPTENYAIKTGLDPRVVTKKNSDNFRRQIQSIGISFDWSREINTTDPKYYKWTQWIFLQFLKKGLAYKAKMSINWCPKDKIGLANEEVVNGCCERCGTPVEKREKEQWMLAITKYAERLDKDLDEVDYLPKIKLGQRNWIGRSEGAEIDFKIISARQDLAEIMKVFTTRADTLFGATYLVLAPEHELVQKLKSKITNWDKVLQYIVANKKKTDMERTAENKEKTGVELKGVKAVNPATEEEIPVWIADYVLAGYGTGAIMAVPAHDERDFEFAKKFKLPIKQVIAPLFVSEDDPPKEGEKMVYRNAIVSIVRNPKTNQYLCLQWNVSDKWRTFITGGIEEGEDPVAAAKREVEEETGYKNLRFIKQLGTEAFEDFYHLVKKTNRHAQFKCLLFDLIDDTKAEVHQEEKNIHEGIWVNEKEVENFVVGKVFKFFWQQSRKNDSAFLGNGVLIHSDNFNGLDSEKAEKEIVKFVKGKEKTTFKLRDWIFSRQRYWGEPIPVVFCDDCGIVPVPEKDLPVELPKVKNYQPTDSGESPLANISKWVNTKCPKCKGKAKRETDTMPNWAGSSWYYLRYTDPKNSKAFASPKNLKYWTPVNWYNGGNEHTTLHLLYSRFWHKFLFDLGLVPTSEPYMKRTAHGIILAEGGEKMSKSKGNVVNPDDIVNRYGADTLRLYEMFMGPFDQAIAWSEEAIIGPRRFLEKVWKIGFRVVSPDASAQDFLLRNVNHSQKHTGSTLQNFSVSAAQRLLHKTIKKVTEDIEEMHFNTAISAMMILATEMERAEFVSKEDYKKFLQILAPFAPYMTEELWFALGEKKSIHVSEWPKWEEGAILDEEVKIVIQINGKLRSEISVARDEEEENVRQKALSDKAISQYLRGVEVKRIIYIKNRLINIVI